MASVSGLMAFGVQRMIGRNPTNVTLVRKTRVRNPTTGGATTTQTQVGPYACRIVTGREAADVFEALGIDVARVSPWVMLAPPEADFDVGERTDEWFDHPTLGRFYTQRAIPLELENYMCGYLVLCRREERGG